MKALRSIFPPLSIGLMPLLVLLALLASRPALAQRVDLELLLAIDGSSSIDTREFDLQMQGIASAFRHPGVKGAIQASGDLGIAVALMQWSDSRNQSLSLDWRLIRDDETAEAFAQAVENTARFVVGGGTAIGSAIDVGVDFVLKSPFQGRRQVIDISGDGRANQGRLPPRARDDAVAKGFTINGLAILNEDQAVDSYYLYNVIGGTGAFIITAQDFQDFQIAIVRKLIQEISGVPIAGVIKGSEGLAFEAKTD